MCALFTLPRILLKRPNSVNHIIPCDPMKSFVLTVVGRGERGKRTRFSYSPQEDKTKIIIIQYRIRRWLSEPVTCLQNE